MKSIIFNPKTITILIVIVIIIKIKYNNPTHDKIYDFCKESNLQISNLSEQSDIQEAFEIKGLKNRKGMTVKYKDIPLKIVSYNYFTDKANGKASLNIADYKKNIMIPDEQLRYKYIFILRHNSIAYIESPIEKFEYGEGFYLLLKEENII